MRSTRKIEQLLKKLTKNVNANVSTNSETDKRILNELLQAQDKTREIEPPFALFKLMRREMSANGIVWKITALVTVLIGVGTIGVIGTGNRGIVIMDNDRTKVSAEAVDVLVASRNLPALTVMTADCFVTKKIPKSELKEKDRPYKVAETLGSVNIQPIVKGQMLTESCFGWGGTSPEVIAKLAPGMYAYTIHISRQTLPDPTFLYPGCVVDVLHIDKLDRSMGGHSISQTLLERVRVIAVSGRTQMRTANPDEKDTQSSSRRSGGTVAVTLEVTNAQAQALELAKGSGIVAMAIRSPSDTAQVDKEAMMLIEGQFARYTPADLANDPNKSSTNPQDPNDQNQRARIFTPIRPGQNRSREVIIQRGNKTERIKVGASHDLPE